MKGRAGKSRGYEHVKLAPRWKKFENFLEDMGAAYDEHILLFGAKDTTIDRIDNRKGYSNGNCRWATRNDQNNNKRNNRLFDYGGKKLNIVSLYAAVRPCVSITCFFQRLTRLGYSIEKAATKPPKIFPSRMKRKNIV